MPASDVRGHAALSKQRANYVPLSPVQFLERSALIWPDKIAVRHGPRRIPMPSSSALPPAGLGVGTAGIGEGDTVAVMAPNIPAMLEAHYAVPALGAVLNALNYRLDARSIAFCLAHGEAKSAADRRRIRADDQGGSGAGRVAACSSSTSTIPEAAARGDGSDRSPTRRCLPKAIRRSPGPGRATSGMRWRCTTRRAPPAIRRASCYHHRGAYLNALGNALDFGLKPRQRLSVDAADVPLQRLDLHLGGDRCRRHACLSAPRRAGAIFAGDPRAPASRTCAARRSC